MSPITLGVEVSEVQAFLLADLDLSNGATDFAGDESTTSARAMGQGWSAPATMQFGYHRLPYLS